MSINHNTNNSAPVNFLVGHSDDPLPTDGCISMWGDTTGSAHYYQILRDGKVFAHGIRDSRQLEELEARQSAIPQNTFRSMSVPGVKNRASARIFLGALGVSKFDEIHPEIQYTLDRVHYC